MDSRMPVQIFAKTRSLVLVRFYDFTAADKNLACLFEAPPAIELAIRFVGPVDKVDG
jgi:hypothetical protein